MRILKRFALILALLVVSSSAGFVQPALGEPDNYSETEIEGIDPGLVAGVWDASMNFSEEIIQEINISEEGFGGEGSIDDLITLMRITLTFTSEVLDTVRAKDMVAEEETNLTLNETDLMADGRIEEAFLYLRFLQSGNLCEEAIKMVDESERREIT